jgi:hypothetical protein
MKIRRRIMLRMSITELKFPLKVPTLDENIRESSSDLFL